MAWLKGGWVCLGAVVVGASGFVAACSGGVEPPPVPLAVIMVRGEVVDGSGAAQTGAAVEVRLIDESGGVAPTGPCGEGNPVVAETETDSEGVFEVEWTLGRFEQDVCVTVLAMVTTSGGGVRMGGVDGVRSRVGVAQVDTVRVDVEIE